MRKYVWALAVVLVVAVIVGGCAGGGEALLQWVRYSPPAEVIAPADLQLLAAKQVVGLPAAVEGDPALFAFGEIPALRNVLYEVLDDVLGQLSGLGTLLPLQAQGPRTDRELVALMKRAVAPPQVRTQQAELNDPFFDWTDPETGVHWTGRVLEQEDGSLQPQLHGVGPETNCIINLTLVFELGSRLRVTGSIGGPIVADVYETAPVVAQLETVPGRAVLDGALDLAVNVISGGDTSFSADTHLAGEFQVPSGGDWRTVNQGEASLQANGSLNDIPQLDVAGVIRRGVTLGPGLYWWRHEFDASLVLEDLGGIGLGQSGTADVSLGNQVTLTDRVSFSDGISGELHLLLNDSTQTLDGVLRAPNGTVLGTIDLGESGEGPPVIHWVDGSDDILI